MTARKNVSSSGSVGTRRRTKRSLDSCSHHWILSSTKYPVFEPNVGQVNLGRTGGRCKKCGKTRRWEAATPDDIHGIESFIAAKIRSEETFVPDKFRRLEEEDYDA